MSHSFEQILHAWSVQDPALVDMLVALTKAPDPQPTTPIPEDELTFDEFLPAPRRHTQRFDELTSHVTLI